MVCEFMMIAVITLIILLVRWNLGCCVCLLPCSGAHNPHPSHRSGIKDGFHELGMEHMSLIPQKQMFCLSLVCQSYDLQPDGFCSPSRWFMGKAADIIFHQNSSKLTRPYSSELLCFFFVCLQHPCFSAIPEQSQLT